jgi:hypothetical protein
MSELTGDVLNYNPLRFSKMVIEWHIADLPDL